MKFVDLYWFLQSLGPQVLGMLLGDDEEEGPAHIASLCALLLKDLHVTSLMIFYYGKKGGGGTSQGKWAQNLLVIHLCISRL